MNLILYFIYNDYTEDMKILRYFRIFKKTVAMKNLTMKTMMIWMITRIKIWEREATLQQTLK